MLFQLKFSFFIIFALMYKSVDVWQTDWFCDVAALKKILWKMNAKKKKIARIHKEKNDIQWNMWKKNNAPPPGYQMVHP